MTDTIQIKLKIPQSNYPFFWNVKTVPWSQDTYDVFILWINSENKRAIIAIFPVISQ